MARRSSMMKSDALVPAGITAAVVGALGYLWYKGKVQPGDVAAVPITALPVGNLSPEAIAAINAAGAQAGITVITTSTMGNTVTGSVNAFVRQGQPPVSLGGAGGSVTVPRKSVTAVWRAGKQVS